MRQVAASALASCPISIAASYAESFLRIAEAGGDGATIVAGPLRRHVHVSFGSSSDATEPGRRSDELHIAWSARLAWLPDFSGTLRFRIASTQTTLLLLNGSYVPPGGIAGRIFDAVIGRWISRATVDDFLARVAGELGRREAGWQRSVDP